MEVMVAAEAAEASTGEAEEVFTAGVAEVSAAAVVFQAAATAAVGIVTVVAGSEVRHGREDPDSDDLDSEDLGLDDLDSEDLGLEDSGTPVASPPVIERRLLTGGGIRLEESAVGLVEATALAVALAFGAASVNAAFLVVVASASAAGAADSGLALAGGSDGIPSGIGHRTGIARGGSTVIHRILIRTSGGHLSAGAGHC
jgi:hypothetical protein